MKLKSLSSRLRHSIVIERKDKLDNGFGGRKANPVTGGWAKLVATRAEIIALRGDEAVRENIERAVQLWKVTIRHRSDVTPKNRIVWGAIAMEIKSAAPNEVGDELVMTCESGANGS